MKKGSVKHGQILIAAIMIALAIPVAAKAKDIGHDWYCPDPEAHAQYEKQRNLHVANDAEIIVEMLTNVYSDPSCSTEQKKANALDIIRKDLSKIRTGFGVGD